MWGRFGVEAEWAPLRTVLLHSPGPELGGGEDPGRLQMLDRPDPGLAREQHLRLVETYRRAGGVACMTGVLRREFEGGA